MDAIRGCGDSGCVVKKPAGMGTNAGCRCLMGLAPDKHVAVRTALAHRRELEAEVVKLRAVAAAAVALAGTPELVGLCDEGDDLKRALRDAGLLKEE